MFQINFRPTAPNPQGYPQQTQYPPINMYNYAGGYYPNPAMYSNPQYPSGNYSNLAARTQAPSSSTNASTSYSNPPVDYLNRQRPTPYNKPQSAVNYFFVLFFGIFWNFLFLFFLMFQLVLIKDPGCRFDKFCNLLVPEYATGTGDGKRGTEPNCLPTRFFSIDVSARYFNVIL